MSAMEHVQKLQEFLNSSDMEKLQSMSQSDKLQYILSSNDFMSNIASGLLNQKNGSPLPTDKVLDLGTMMGNIITNTNPTTSHSNFYSTTAFNSFSKEEKLQIQQKLSIYDNTLKSTLDAIKNGQIPNDDVHSIDEMNKLLKDVESSTTTNSNIKKLKINEDISASLESSVPTNSLNSSNASKSSQKEAATADEYIEQLIKIINHNKKFDNFLEEVSKIESLTQNEQQQQQQQKEECDSNDDDSCKLTLEYDNEGRLINTGLDTFLKNKINTQIVKALESFKLDDNLEDDIANAIAKSFENNQNLLPDLNDKNLELFTADRNGLSFDSFTAQLKEYKKRYIQQIESQSMAMFKDALANSNSSPSVPFNQSSPNSKQQNVKQVDNESHVNTKSPNIQQSEKFHKNHTNQRQNKTKNTNKNKNKNKNKNIECYINTSPEQKRTLQRECLERLQMQDLKLAEETMSKSKKKRNKKKNKGANGSYGSYIVDNGMGLSYTGHINGNNSSNHNNNDLWLCGLCEYKIVYGEVPIFLNEWLQKKANHHEKMETYQRYLMEQRKDKMRQKQNATGHHNHHHNRHHSIDSDDEHGHVCPHYHGHCEHDDEEEDEDDDEDYEDEDEDEVDYQDDEDNDHHRS